MNIEIIKKETEWIFKVDGSEYPVATRPGFTPSVKDEEEVFNAKAPNLTQEVSDWFYHYLWGGMKLWRVNTNPWGWNGGGRRSWRR